MTDTPSPQNAERTPDRESSTPAPTSSVTSSFEFSDSSIRAMRKLTAFKFARLAIWAFVLFGLAPQLILLVPSQWTELSTIPRILMTLVELLSRLEQWLSAHWSLFLLLTFGISVLLTVSNLNQMLKCVSLIGDTALCSKEKFEIAHKGYRRIKAAYKYIVFGMGVSVLLVAISAFYKGIAYPETFVDSAASLAFIAGLFGLIIFDDTPILNFLIPKELKEACRAPENHALMGRAFREVFHRQWTSEASLVCHQYSRLYFYILCDRIGELELWRNEEKRHGSY